MVNKDKTVILFVGSTDWQANGQAGTADRGLEAYPGPAFVFAMGDTLCNGAVVHMKLLSTKGKGLPATAGCAALMDLLGLSYGNHMRWHIYMHPDPRPMNPEPGVMALKCLGKSVATENWTRVEKKMEKCRQSDW